MNVQRSSVTRVSNKIPTDQNERKTNVYQVGIKGNNVEINADNVYIINNTYNEPVYNNYRFVPYHNGFNYIFHPFSFSFLPLWCYTIPFVPWVPWIFSWIWRC